jgi:trehalose-6-phosphatase
MEIRADFKRINIEDCSSSLAKANKAVIIIETEALPHLKFSKHSIPTNEVIEQLRGLLVDKRCTIILLSNQSKETMTQWFGRSSGSSLGNQFWLAAESGYLYQTGNDDWK